MKQDFTTTITTTITTTTTTTTTIVVVVQILNPLLQRHEHGKCQYRSKTF